MLRPMFWAYLSEFGADWKNLVSGIGSIILVVLGIFWGIVFPGSSLPNWTFWVLAVICLEIAHYRIWSQIRPIFIIDLEDVILDAGVDGVEEQLGTYVTIRVILAETK